VVNRCPKRAISFVERMDAVRSGKHEDISCTFDQCIGTILDGHLKLSLLINLQVGTKVPPVNTGFSGSVADRIEIITSLEAIEILAEGFFCIVAEDEVGVYLDAQISSGSDAIQSIGFCSGSPGRSEVIPFKDGVAISIGNVLDEFVGKDEVIVLLEGAKFM